MEKLKTGFIAVVGKPNVGKSSLVNKIVGSKVSITGPKAQTTRDKILGILNENNYQLVFVDTPGDISPKSKLDEYMRKSIDAGVLGIDALVIVLDANKINDRDYKLIENYSGVKVPVFVVINKKDIGEYKKVYPMLGKLNDYKFVTEFFSVSAKTGENIDALVSSLKSVMPEGYPYFDTNAVTDKTERFLVAEIVREKSLLFLQQEIPHGIATYVNKYEDKKNIVNIEIDIIANKESHKPIIIGKDGGMLKKIGTSARQEIEQMLEKKVNLKLFVKVRAGWQDDLSKLNLFGYNKKNI